MTQLPTNRTSANTVAEHVDDHNILAAEHNDLDGHAAATTTVHGITNTAGLETTTGSAAKVAAHEADTTAVHGITDTSTLVLTSDSRLSDTRTPTDGSVTNAKVAANAAIAKTKLASLDIVNADVNAAAAIAKSKLAALAIVDADVDAAAAVAESKLALASDAAAGTASRRTLGTGAAQAAAGDHAHSGSYVVGTVTLTVASSAPGSPTTNDLWVDTT